jgi:hypothetical protein
MVVREDMEAGASVPAESKGRIVRTYSEGQAILWSYVPELPSDEDCRARPWLTVLTWVYDGTTNLGMPDEATNQLMLQLDGALENVENPTSCAEAYRRIGGGLREFVYYTADQEEFMDRLNSILADHPPYPIEIKFYEDDSWSDFKKLIADFSDA